METAELRRRMTLDAFPRAAAYDPWWMVDNEMGPNPLWLTEFLTGALPLEPGMRVLDLGCGRAASSIFLAREFGVRVWASDLWIAPSENWRRIVDAGLEELICPVRVEAHELPYAHGFFDAIVSMDAYHYFGTDDTYLLDVSRFLRPGGRIGIVVPGLRREFDGEVPDRIRPHWEPEWYAFHSPDWWAHHWRRTGVVDVEVADTMPDGWRTWLHWELTAQASGRWQRTGDIELLRADGGEYLTFTRVVARGRA